MRRLCGSAYALQVEDFLRRVQVHPLWISTNVLMSLLAVEHAGVARTKRDAAQLLSPCSTRLGYCNEVMWAVMGSLIHRYHCRSLMSRPRHLRWGLLSRVPGSLLLSSVLWDPGRQQFTRFEHALFLYRNFLPGNPRSASATTT